MYKVLLVEDEEMIRKGLRFTFDWLSAGCVVVGEAENGEEGLSQIRALGPDIVIVDVNMPLMDGIAMIERSVEEAACSYIILSGYDEFRLAKEAIRLGVTEYLLKPLEQDQLLAALERAKSQVEMKRQFAAMKTSGAGSGEALQASVVKLPGKSSRYVSKMIQYVQEHYAQKIGIKDLVERLEVSATYLNQKFKSETTYTFNDFLNRYRIQKAMELLQHSEEKVYRIAADVGFKDYKYFIAIFKKYAGCTPSHYQERFGQGAEERSDPSV
ncbi:response regulator transcription factor [Paenibacillus sinopodophylli]|uniref:response regulator transcription factor n=1 Tax=Paenibacillus sinopodophylli TaxID=1837342 RepID=UPI00110CC5A6|nr:response regulator [Paenibacillus sinopodophylli]